MQQKHVLEAYRYISDSAPPEVEADKGSHWLIGSSLLAYRTQVQLTLGAAFNYIARDADSKSKFLVAVNEGILNLLTGAGAEASWQQEVQKRLVIKDVVEGNYYQVSIDTRWFIDFPINFGFQS